MKHWPKTEAELAAVVVAWLRDLRWDVYQEVDAYGCVADIVATQGALLWVVETKTSLGLRVMEQAWFWRRRAHYVSVAYPRSKRASSYALRCLERDGIGALEVRAPDGWTPELSRVREVGAAALSRRVAPGLAGKLHEEQKTYAPAGSQGKRWTPFIGTCEELRRYVEAHPGVTLAETVKAIKTHYHTVSTARSSLAKWIQAGVVAGVRCELEGKALRLYAEAMCQKSAPQ